MLALCCQAGDPSLGGWDSPRKLGRDEIEAIVDGFSRFDSPCRYLLKGTELFLEHPETVALWRVFREATKEGADGSAAPRRAALEEAFHGLAADLSTRPGPFMRVFTHRIGFTPELQVQSSGRSWSETTSGNLRCLSFNLTYDNYQGSEHYLQIFPPSPSPALYDPRMLFQPLLLDAQSLHWWREWDWEERGTSDLTRRVFQLFPGDPARHFRIELDGTTGLPLAASYRHDPGAPGVLNLALYEFGSVSSDSPQVWLRSVLAINDDRGKAMLARYEISEVEFDVGPEDLLLDVLAGTVLFDERGPERKTYGSKPEAWPLELAPLIRLQERSARPDALDPGGASVSLSSVLTASGVVLLIAGGALVLHGRRKGVTPA